MAKFKTGSECDFIDQARGLYRKGDDIVDTLDRQKKIAPGRQRTLTKDLKFYISEIEDFLWKALEKDYPKFKYRKTGQTIVVSYLGTGASVTINPGEINKIKPWGHNDYYEALDTINRLQSRMYTLTVKLDRNWLDDWKRLNKQINVVFERNCKKEVEEFVPGPVIILPPPTIPPPENPPGPGYIEWPPLPISQYPSWEERNKRNWSVTGWYDYGSSIPGTVGIALAPNAPNIVKIEGREFIYYKPTTVTRASKVLWIFHSGGGHARGYFVGYEKLKYIKKFLDAGYLVCAYESHNRSTGKWALTADKVKNKDIIGLKACQKFLIDKNLVNYVLPSCMPMINPFTGVTSYPDCQPVITATQYGIGHGRGGDMVSYVATSMNLAKIMIHNAPGVDGAFQATTYNVPTAWLLSANDNASGDNVNPGATANFNWMITNKPSVSTALYTQAATRIKAETFDDMPGVSTLVANAIVSGLYSGGFIDVSGDPTIKYINATNKVRRDYIEETIPAIVATAFGADTENYRRYVNDIIDQIQISFSDHTFSGSQRSMSGPTLVLTDRDLAWLS